MELCPKLYLKGICCVIFREEKSESLAEMKDELEHNRAQVAKLRTEVSTNGL